MHPKKIWLVSATRKTRKDFFDHAALGKSLRLYKGMPGWQLCLFAENAQPLPIVYKGDQRLRRRSGDPGIRP
jgi:hypothetical protein